MTIEFHEVPGIIDLSRSTCAFIVAGESRYGSCDQIECGCGSREICNSEECVNCPCPAHARLCWVCQNFFCHSSDRTFETCFSQHRVSGTCHEAIIKAPLVKLVRALDSGCARELEHFVLHDSDGLGNPLPMDIAINLGLGVAYANNLIPEFKHEALIAHHNAARKRRTERQRMRRAAKRLGFQPPPSRQNPYIHLAPERNSTMHIATGALLIQHWTGACHYRKQMQILEIMGLHKSEDFVRNKLGYIRSKNPQLFARLDYLAVRALPFRRGA